MSFLLEEFESLQRGFWNLYNELLKVAPNHVCKKYLENEERLENEFREAYNKGDEERCKHIIKRMEQLCRGVANAIEKYGGYTPGTKPPSRLEKILPERARKKLGDFREWRRKPYICPRCGKGFYTEGELVKHIATQHPDYYAYLDDIDKEIRRSSGKVRHIRGIVGKAHIAEEWKGYVRFHIFPAVIGVIVSAAVFSFLQNPYLLAAGVIFSLSLLFPKEDVYGFVKAIFVFLAVIMAFLGVQFVHKFLALIVLFAGYTLLSFRPISEEAYYFEGALAVFRAIIGALIAVSPWFVFSLPLFDPVAMGLGLIGIGFFVLSFPEQEIPASIRGKGITIINEIGKKHAPLLSVVAGACVLFGMLLSLSAIISDTGFGFRAILFLILGLVSAFIAYSIPGHYRGEVGFPLYLLLLFTVTTAYPDMLGQAVFGQWWPQVSAGIESVSKPLETGFSQLRQGMSDIWLMFTCPSCYYEKKIKEQQTKSKAEGSVLSLELVSFKPFSQYLDPAQNFGAMVTMQNKGESEIKELEIHVLDPQIKVGTGRKQEWKKISTTKEITSCTGSAEGETCEKDVVYPNEYVQFAFTLSNFGKIEGTEDTLDKCVCSIPGLGGFDCDTCENCNISIKTPIQNLERFINYGFQCTFAQGLSGKEEAREAYCEGFCNTSKEGVYLTYKYGNYPVKLRFNYSFRYEATVSLQVMAMKKELYEKMLKEGKLAQKEVISKYSGGPVLLSIWTPMEPIVVENNGITVNFRIKNQGTGKVLKEKKGKRTKLTITLPEGAGLIGDIKNIVKFYVGECYQGTSSEQEITCYLSKDLNPGEEAGFSFVATLPNFEGDTKTLTFTGNVTYIYGNEMEKKVFVISAPLS